MTNLHGRILLDRRIEPMISWTQVGCASDPAKFMWKLTTEIKSKFKNKVHITEERYYPLYNVGGRELAPINKKRICQWAKETLELSDTSPSNFLCDYLPLSDMLLFRIPAVSQYYCSVWSGHNFSTIKVNQVPINTLLLTQILYKMSVLPHCILLPHITEISPNFHDILKRRLKIPTPEKKCNPLNRLALNKSNILVKLGLIFQTKQMLSTNPHYKITK